MFAGCELYIALKISFEHLWTMIDMLHLLVIDWYYLSFKPFTNAINHPQNNNFLWYVMVCLPSQNDGFLCYNQVSHMNPLYFSHVPYENWNQHSSPIKNHWQNHHVSVVSNGFLHGFLGVFPRFPAMFSIAGEVESKGICSMCSSSWALASSPSFRYGETPSHMAMLETQHGD